ncbi:MAG TPA: S8 family serine peptidase [Gaiellaceae bacterium]|nr:S8 family serine peptidase [Gaiellaceae bacterium]
MKKRRVAVLGAVVAALVATPVAAAFTPTNSYFTKQWYLGQDSAFDAWPAPPTDLAPVKVAIVDSGVDCDLPDLKGQIAKSKSFVVGDPCTDTQGHGTIVAGEIAGALDQAGVVGLAYSSQLLVAKVVAADGSIPIQAEAAAIRWAVKQGARVVNLSFGAVRDPANPALDTYSKVEAQAVAYAVRKGAVVVAAVGNGDEAYTTPWPYASWPAALPHVIGVGALTRSGGVPDFSDEDPTFVDLAAPGVGIFSTFPTALTAQQTGCAPQGYTDCATGAYHHPEGTSFAAPQVSAAAAVLFGLHPGLSSSQVTRILERHADDVGPSSTCVDTACPAGRDRYSGWGSLDVAKAVDFLDSGAPLPPTDRLEPNDSAPQARKLFGKRPDLQATLDYWDDRVDVYRVRLVRGQRLHARVAARWAHAALELSLWPPGTKSVFRSRGQVAQTRHPGKNQRLSYRATRGGWYLVELRTTRHGGGRYALQLTKSR